MKITCDPEKRAATLATRGLDMKSDARAVFAGDTLTVEDDRHDYGEARFITIGFVSGRMVLVAWTVRDGTRRIISMRKANAREQAKYAGRFSD